MFLNLTNGSNPSISQYLPGRCRRAGTGGARLSADQKTGPKIGAGVSTFEKFLVVNFSKVENGSDFSTWQVKESRYGRSATLGGRAHEPRPHPIWHT